ncbi:MAG: GNAT family N-acetyltransferase [Ruminiclostridium sp.]|nr:GNAT family N-acetyltransferase [Ruminiclostridium sp.]
MEKSFFIRKAKDKDMEEVFNLSNQDYVRKYSINKEKIKWEDHISWFNNILNENNNVFYVVTDSTDQFLGQIRYKITDNIAAISISLSHSIIGKGLSRPLLLESIEKLFEEKNEVNEIVAYVSKENIASAKLFANAGFLFYGEEKDLARYIYSR